MSRLFSVPLLLVLALSSAAARAEVDLLTSIKPLQLIAAAVQDGVGTPAVLLPAGASAHQYSLRPSDVQHVREADLFYWIGPDMESFLAPVLEGRRGPQLALQSLDGLQLRHFGDEHAEHDEHEDEHAEQGNDHGDHGHDAHEAESPAEHDHAHRPGSLDAHLWLLPDNARLIAKRMAADLAEADPANAERYQANLAAFGDRLDALDQRLRERLAKVGDKPFFVFHEAYDYFESAYGLRHAGVFSAGGEAQPGARHVAAMRQRLQQAGPSCVFYEPPQAPKLAANLSRGLPVRLVALDPMGGDLTADAHGYEQLLEQLGDALAGCLEALCAGRAAASAQYAARRIARSAGFTRPTNLEALYNGL